MGNSGIGGADAKSAPGGNAGSIHPYTDGFHILKVQPGGPGEKAGLRAYFDFIVAADGVLVGGPHNGVLVEKINEAHQSVGGVKLTILNTREDSVRETVLYPRNTWVGSGLIGISIRPTSLASASEFVWHILEVIPSSPAAEAELQPFTDYIVGTPIELFKTADDFYSLVESEARAAQPMPIEFYVYNSLSDAIRTVAITPNPNWGGSGSLGCNVGFGILHRIPTKPATHQAKAAAQLAQSKSTTGHSHGHVPCHGHGHSHHHADDDHHHDHDHEHEHDHDPDSHDDNHDHPDHGRTRDLHEHQGAHTLEDVQIQLQQQIHAARAKRLAAEQEEAELQFKLSHLPSL